MDKLLETAANKAAQYGVEYCGICPISCLSQLLPSRKKSMVPPIGSVITLLFPYCTGVHPQRNVALYAVPDDYHRIAGGILEQVAASLKKAFPNGTFVAFVDSSPIPEVEAACLGGLGFRGRNGQLITERYGSMTFIGEIVTDIETGSYTRPEPWGDCGDCRRCLEACPTGALDCGTPDTVRCRSAITQKKGELSQWEREQVKTGGLVWGCDICTLVCPYNEKCENTPVTGMFENLIPTVTEDKLNELISDKSYGWRGEAVLKRNLNIVNE